MRTLLKAIILTLCSSWSVNVICDAIFRWVDEDGKVHFGESVPPQFNDVAEQLETPPINTLAPEPEVKKQNDRAVRKLRAEDSARNRLKDDKKNTATGTPQRGSELTREHCRDNYVTVKQRTECFAQAL